MHNEGCGSYLCLVALVFSAASAVAGSIPGAADFDPDEAGLDKRGWANFHGSYGKRAWNNFQGGYGKRFAAFDYVSERLRE